MKRIVSLLLFGLPLFGNQLTTDPPILWDTECTPCTPPTLCPLPVFDKHHPVEDVSLDLINPLYENGIISTTEGGVLRGNCLRIQARHIVYTKQQDTFSVYCAGDLVIDYKNHIITGETLYYDFISHTGRVTCGKTAAFPWFLGGEEILLCENGTLVIHNGYVTTSEGGEKEVMALSPKITVTPHQVLSAEKITFRVKNAPLLWIPKGGVDLKSTKDSPIGFNFGWNGFLGTYLGLRYHFLTIGAFKGYARADGYFGRGLGLGFESEYDPKCSPTECYTRNYYAHDISIDDPEKKDRYRIEGSYYSQFFSERTSLQILYDFVSDAQMAADYVTHDFELNPAQRTELNLRHESASWIANFYTRVRVNTFQSVNQELPAFEMALHPFELFDSGVIFNNAFNVSFLDYVFSDDVKGAHNFHSGRFEVRPEFYRPLPLGVVKVTPKARFIGIAYSDSPSRHAVGQALGDLGGVAEMTLDRFFGPVKHTLIPYADYHFLTTPKVPLDQHYLFTIADAYAYLNFMRFGMRHLLFFPPNCCALSPLRFDLWATAFFNTHTVPEVIQKGYLQVDWQPHPRLFWNLDTSWNFQDHVWDYLNTRVEWTLSRQIACAGEYRRRSSFAWRKNDFYNFLLEATRSQESLLASPLSDRRDTLLGRVYCHLTPDIGVRFEVRHGWNRLHQPPYTEYMAELETVLFQHWKFRFAYEKREEDNRYQMSLKLDPGAPSCRKGV